jgi:hypothetical protein
MITTNHSSRRTGLGSQRWACAALIAVGLAAGLPASSALAAPVGLHRVYTLTLARVDRRCFYYPSPAGGWPLYRTGLTHAIRGGFNDPRGWYAAHFGVDVAARRDQANVYAVTSGLVWYVRLNGPNAKFILSPNTNLVTTRYDYWHVALTQVAPDSIVTRGQWIGTVVPHAGHVHLSEWTPSCGYLDPRRPTGILRDPANTEQPSITHLSAYVANKAAFAGIAPGPDHSTPLPLTNLHGTVDFRADVSDTPIHATKRWPQQPLMVAGVRSWIAPTTSQRLRIGKPIYAYRGARLIPSTQFNQIYAPGTVRENSCFKNPRAHCRTRLVLHVAGRGIDTTRLPNGTYQYCVSAVTIRNIPHHTCWPITIHNGGARGEQ